ncbi:MAG: cytochrome [Bdellovibrionaceae bacterium]|nr:cytochrome [Pseudobdellovibrionaceae bacterium]
MFIQGDLQAVFDALYAMGIIDPVLKMDWQTIHDDMNREPQKLKQALKAINLCGGNRDALIKTIQGFEAATVNFVALEVARELAESNNIQVLH